MKKVLFLISEDYYFLSHRFDLAKAVQAAGFEVAVKPVILGSFAAWVSRVPRVVNALGGGCLDKDEPKIAINLHHNRE